MNSLYLVDQSLLKCIYLSEHGFDECTVAVCGGI
jgi:hypothetical protein